MSVLNSLFRYFPLFVKVIFLQYAFLIFLRGFEFVAGIIQGTSVGFTDTLIYGFAGDLLVINAAMVAGFIVFRLLAIYKPGFAANAFAVLSFLYYTLSLLPVIYFLNTGEIVGLNSFECRTGLAFTNLLGDTSILQVMLMIVIFSFLLVFWYRSLWLKKWVITTTISRLMAVVLILSTVAAFELSYNSDFFDRNSNRINKGFFFTKTTYQCLVSGDPGRGLTGIDLYHYKLGIKEPYIPEYPLLQYFQREDCLGSFFNKTDNDSPPDIVLIVVDGLGDEFIHTFHDFEFMPFLGKLSREGLYWNRFLATSEEGQSVLPSLLGGLPHGQNGFSTLGRIPYHYSLVNVLNHNSYHTSFFYGRWAWELSREKFLEQNNIDFIWDAGKFPDSYEKIYTGEENFHWGYNDADLYSNYFARSKDFPANPKFDIVYPVSVRSPFAVGNRQYYDEKYEAMIGGVTSASQREYFTILEGYFKALMFGDDALESFFTQYRQKPNYRNTIFIITGSYPTPDYATPDPFGKYHVPLIITSPLLKENRIFTEVSSHNDLYHALLTFLNQEYGLEIPEYSTSLGGALCKSREERPDVFVPFLGHDGTVKDLLFNDLFLSDRRKLYEVDNNFNIIPADNSKDLDMMISLVDAYNQINSLASVQLMDDSLYFGFFGYKVMLDTIMPSQRVRSEYKNIIPRMPVENQTHYIDIFLAKPDVALDEVFIVFELTDQEGIVLQWVNMGIPTSREDFSLRITSEKNDSEEQLYLQLYLWNESPLPYNFQKLRTTLYRKDEHSIQ
jgi:hypothetical protein